MIIGASPRHRHSFFARNSFFHKITAISQFHISYISKAIILALVEQTSNSMYPLSFSGVEYHCKRKQTCRKKPLAETERVVHGRRLARLITPRYPKAGARNWSLQRVLELRDVPPFQSLWPIGKAGDLKPRLPLLVSEESKDSFIQRLLKQTATQGVLNGPTHPA